MAAYNFQKRFVPMIESGHKMQTIRRVGKRRHARPGERVQLYTGMRTKSCRKIVEPDPICLTVDPVALMVGSSRIERIRFGEQVSTDSEEAIRRFAVADGFADGDDFYSFWRDFHGAGLFEGLLIQWGDDHAC